jgi:quercetin 2,3-dioxygenase
MSGFKPFLCERRAFVKNILGISALYFLKPFQLFSQTKKDQPKMIELIKKSEQFNDVYFEGKFVVNKPIFPRQENVKPYSNIIYWSNGFAKEYCSFALHPHQGYEILTFLFEGQIDHFDTSTNVWTPLNAGGFQVIQSNSGIQHQEKLNKGSKSFQIWFDPNLEKAYKLTPSYIDYHSKDFQPKMENGIETVTYVGASSIAKVLTPGLIIKKLIFVKQTKTTLTLDKNSSYTFYLLNGKGSADKFNMDVDDAIRISDTSSIDLDFTGELFYIATPTKLDYNVVTL